MSRITTITLSPSVFAELSARFTVPQNAVAKYAKLYVDHAKEETSLSEFVRRASDDVYPPKFASRGQVAVFRQALRKEIRRMERLGRSGW